MERASRNQNTPNDAHTTEVLQIVVANILLLCKWSSTGIYLIFTEAGIL